jgi:hypothetical protein
MEITRQFGRISRLLSYPAKHKVLSAAPIFVMRTRAIRDSERLWRTAVEVLRPNFPSLSEQEVNVLVFYLVAKVGITLSKAPQGSQGTMGPVILLESLTRKLDYLSETEEMASLRLQVMMERIPKIIQTLSAIVNRVSGTQDTVIQHLK